MRSFPRVLALLIPLLFLHGGGLTAGDPVEAGDPLGKSYTAAELEALDRALHAVNMDRRDLTFKKDVTEGHACLEAVRAMLADPLRIAPETDAFVAEAGAVERHFHAPLGGLVAARDRFPHTMPLVEQITDVPFEMLADYLGLHDRN